jgi:putative ABC transport system permease protein
MKGTMLNDLRYALRTLRRSPGFAASAILALALGIGANTAVFSVVYAVLLNPLPYPDAEQIVRLYEANPAQGIERGEVSPGTFVDWRARSRTLEGLGVYTRGEALWSFGDQYDVIKFSAVSPAIFSLLRARPILGRTFRPEAEQDKPAGDSGEVVISDGLWQRRFGGAADVVGRSVRVEGRFPLQIIGVMPRGFAFPDATDAWGNLPFVRAVGQGQRQTRYHSVIARLARGASLANARAELASISSQLEVEQPRSNAGWTAQMEPLSTATTRDSRGALLALLGAVGGVLLIGCANVANLLLARATARRREMAVRVALGAGTARLVRQCFTEALVLAASGAAAGLLLGRWMTGVLVSLAPPDIPRLGEAGMNGPLLAFAIGAALVSAACIGIAPAFQVRRAERDGGLRPDGRASTGRGAGVRRLLIAGEVAVVVLLLTSATLLIRSFTKLRGVDLGFAAERVLMIEMRWPVGRFATPTRRPWFLVQQGVDGMVAAVRSLPGVEAAGMMTDPPLTGEAFTGSMWPADAPGASGIKPPASARDQWKAQLSIVTPEYFAAMNIPLMRGRHFTDADRFTEQELTNMDVPRPQGVAVINQAMVTRYFAGQDPLGRALVLFDDQPYSSSRIVVGVVADVRGHAVAEAAMPAIFVPHAQHPGVFRPSLVVRSALPPESLAAVVRDRLRTYDPQLIVLRTRTMNEVVSGSLSRPRFNLLLIASFAFVALGLAAIGIYGVVAFLVTQRTREIGIRMALGARAVDVVRLVLREGMAPVVFGAMAGMLASLAATRAIRTMLFGVTPLDPVSFAVAPAVLATVALLACYLPARRATRVDPLVALRDE